MKSTLVLALICVVLVSQGAAYELVKNYAIALRWPSATATCPPGKILLSGGGNCQSLGMVGWVFFNGNYPPNDREWTVSCDTPKEQNVLAEVWVICK